MRERARLSTRGRRTRDDHEDQPAAPASKIAPGRLRATDVADWPELDFTAVAPGRLTNEDVGRHMDPAVGLAYAQSLLIDRRSEADETVDEGALASAFSFIDEGRGDRLPTELAARLSRELGVDLSDVRVHTDERAATAAATLHARAFTIGDDIYFARGAYDPSSPAGIELIAHEVAHVAQQRRGDSRARRGVSQRGDAHERAADDFARRFTASTSRRFEHADAADLVEHVRAEGRRSALPFQKELEEHFGTSLDFVETYTGEAAELACQLMAASAFVVRNIVAIADPSPQRDLLLHELTHVVQSGGAGRLAPERFRPGSLSVGAADSPVEREADRHPTAPRETADANTVHRATKKAATDPVDRVKDWIGDSSNGIPGFEDFSGKNKRPRVRFGFKSGNQFHPRYWKSQSDSWAADRYTKKNPAHKKEDLQAVTTAGGDVGDGKRLHKVGKEWVMTRASKAPGDTYEKSIDELETPNKWTLAYYGDGTRGISKLDKVVDKLKWGAGDRHDAWDPAATDEELGQYRDAIEKTIAEHYKATPGKWQKFYKEVVQGNVFPHPYKRIVGNVFEKLVAESTKDEDEFPVDGKQLVIVWKGKKKSSIVAAIGDGKVEDEAGKKTIIAECKAWTKPPGTTEKAQAKRYREIIEDAQAFEEKGPDGDVVPVEFDHVVYYFADVEVAELWRKMLVGVFGKPGVSTLYSVVPPFKKMDGKKFRVRYNPEFELTVPEGQNHVKMASPGIHHAGLDAKNLDVNFDDAGNLTSGWITTSLDLAGAAKTAPKKQKIESDGAGGGTVKNEFPGVKTSLTKILGERFKPTARLTDKGVEAEAEITAGPSGIPGFELTGGKLTISYTNDGVLSVSGAAGVQRKVRDGTIGGDLKIGYTAGDWSVYGDIDVSKGVIDGVNAFKAGFLYDAGKVSITCDKIEVEKEFKAITLKGEGRNVVYDVDKRSFSGDARLEADLGAFGTASASATFKNNKLAQAEFTYDSPELKYPAKKDPPALSGSIGGTLTYEDGKFSGGFRGSARINVPGLNKLAGESGLGLAVDAHVKSDGSYGGTIKTTEELKFGDHLRIPSISATLEPDGSVKGSFEVKVKDIKFLGDAEVKCTFSKDGIDIDSARWDKSFGSAEKDKFWGSLFVGYSKEKGLELGGKVNCKIKEGMVATGDLKYEGETGKVSLELGIEKIPIIGHKTEPKTLFKANKQIPVISLFGIIGAYIDIGFELKFEFDLTLDLKPTLKFDGFSLKTFEYDKISAELELLGAMVARLIGEPKLGLGIYVFDPMILRGGGGVIIPIVGEAKLKPTGKLDVAYSPDGGVSGDVSLGMSMTFGMYASVQPYAEFSVLDGMWEPSWRGVGTDKLWILKERELFNFTLDLGGDMTKKEPQLPGENSAAEAKGPPPASKTLDQEKGKEEDRKGPEPDRNHEGGSAEVPEGGDEGPFSMSSLKGMLNKLGPVQDVERILKKAKEVWDAIAGFFGRVMKVFAGFFEDLVSQIEEILDGFAKKGLGYLPELLRKMMGEDLYNVVEPIITKAAENGEALMSLLEQDLPSSVGEFFEWTLRMAKAVFGLVFDSITELPGTLKRLANLISDMFIEFVSYLIKEGYIGVRRHHYYITTPPGFDNIHFMVATEYKVWGYHHPDDSDYLIDPEGAVAFALYQVFEVLGVPPTTDEYCDGADEYYRHRWDS